MRTTIIIAVLAAALLSTATATAADCITRHLAGEYWMPDGGDGCDVIITRDGQADILCPGSEFWGERFRVWPDAGCTSRLWLWNVDHWMVALQMFVQIVSVRGGPHDLPEVLAEKPSAGVTRIVLMGE